MTTQEFRETGILSSTFAEMMKSETGKAFLEVVDTESPLRNGNKGNASADRILGQIEGYYTLANMISALQIPIVKVVDPTKEPSTYGVKNA